MSGRGDNNKNGTSGSGASNQSGQGLAQTDSREKMNHGKETGGQLSEREEKEPNQESNRNISVDKKPS